MSNYPDDIRSYDDDPRSPFCREWHCPECGGHELDVDCEPGNCVADDEMVFFLCDDCNEEYQVRESTQHCQMCGKAACN